MQIIAFSLLCLFLNIWPKQKMPRSHTSKCSMWSFCFNMFFLYYLFLELLSFVIMNQFIVHKRRGKRGLFIKILVAICQGNFTFIHCVQITSIIIYSLVLKIFAQLWRRGQNQMFLRCFFFWLKCLLGLLGYLSSDQMFLGSCFRLFYSLVNVF